MLLFNVEKELPVLKEVEFAEQVLNHCEVEHPELFLNHEKHVDKFWTNPMDMYGIVDSAALYLESIKLNKKIGVIVDDDADGFSSAATLVKLHKTLIDSELVAIFHDRKHHGLKGEIEKIIESGVELLIVPDAGSNDFVEHAKLYEAGIDLIVLDHHSVDNQKKLMKTIEEREGKFLIANNQLEANEDTNVNFVGAGMVYKFAEMIDMLNRTENAKELLDIVAMGQIGDASDLSDYEIHHIVRKGLDNLKSPILKEIFAEEIENGTKIAPINLSFRIIPFVNAVTRVGTLEEKQLLLDVLSDKWPEDEKVKIMKRRKNKITGKFGQVEEEWTHYAIAMDTMTKIKARQNKEVEKIEKMAPELATVEGICIAVIPEEDIEYRSITGLIANKLVAKYQMPVLILVEDEKGNIAGSGRGYEKLFKSFREWCLNTGKFDLAQGHDNAFGVVIQKENMIELRENLVKEFEKPTQPVYDVDKLYEGKTNIEEVIMINDNKEIFGGKVVNPQFGYKNVKIARNCLNQRGSVVTLFHGGLEFIMYKQTPGFVDEFLQTMGFEQYLVADLVGSASRSTWTGRTKDQIVLDDFEIRKFVEGEIEEESAFDDNGDLSF